MASLSMAEGAQKIALGGLLQRLTDSPVALMQGAGKPAGGMAVCIQFGINAA